MTRKEYKEFVYKIAQVVAEKVKGKIYYGYDRSTENWYIEIKTKELGLLRMYLYSLEYDILACKSTLTIASEIIITYNIRVTKRFFK